MTWHRIGGHVSPGVTILTVNCNGAGFPDVSGEYWYCLRGGGITAHSALPYISVTVKASPKPPPVIALASAVDGYLMIPETNESNNTASSHITVTGG